MVRKYQRTSGTRTYRDYTDTQLNEAIQKIADNELSIKAASQRRTGGQTVFTDLEEKAILNSALKCADWGFPLDLLEIRMLAKKYLDLKGRRVEKFQNNVPGKDWALSLLDRHKDQTSQRVSGNIKKARAKETLNNVAPSNIFNYDETNVGDNPGSRRLVYRRGVKYPENIVNHSKSCTTIMICGSADGTLLPPYIIYKSEHLYNTWKEGGITGYPCCTKPCCSQGCRFNRTSHGWIDAVTFKDWFCSSFLPHTKRLEGRKVLIGDNLASHFNKQVLAKCEENNISFVCLVPHSSHICQPLDVAFFKPFKVAWRNILTTYKLRNNLPGIPKEVFPSLLKSAIDKIDTVQAQRKDKPGAQETGVKRNIINGFDATGICPINPDKVLNKIPNFSHNPEQEINDSLRTRTSSGEEDSEQEEEIVMVEEEDDGDEGLEDEVEYITPSENLLRPETFVLVKFASGRRRCTIFKYVLESDLSTVPNSNIIAILPTPTELDEKEYEFSAKVDVKEL
ncbi:hypothetical protein NQ314_016579 [Rhamnusium bicolor]|uniref:DDE-1 domain-containing protein n=1 Tax=Rhamnusium bicolor TaxID=1586634 RepID=A0AAV8WVB7_9CUCU|nr:hypothetical protein NQ314_016579 [Rhamnusium bicolor]